MNTYQHRLKQLIMSLLFAFMGILPQSVLAQEHEHDFQPTSEQGTFTWSADYSTAKLNLQCTCGETSRVDADVEVVDDAQNWKDASCSISGLHTYHAYSYYKNNYYEEFKPIFIPCHTFAEGETNGLCSVCGKYIAIQGDEDAVAVGTTDVSGTQNLSPTPSTGNM